MKVMPTVAIIAISLVSVVWVNGSNYRPLPTMPDKWFDSYGALNWEDEKAHLDNFAIALQRDPNLVGYILVYAGKRACANQAKDHALRATKYLVATRGVAENRIKWIDGGHREDLTVILQPLPQEAPELKASPTVKPDDVVIKDCKPKSSKRKSVGS
jgi:hypothetical protein